MKIKQALIVTAGLAMIGTVAFFLDKASERKSEVAGEEAHEAMERREKEDAARFNVERMKYEYEMLKDPVTGKIPQGIFEKEVAFALKMPVKNVDVPTGANRRVVVQNTYLPAGPNNIGGRTRAVAYDKRYNGSTNRVIISGCVSGGIMRSADGGNTWTLVTPQNDIHSFTTLAQDPRPGFEDTWYAAGGEPYGNTAGGYYAAPYRGFGIWKTLNNGISWTKLTPTVTDQGGGTIPPGTHEFFDNPFDYTYNMAVNPTNGDLFVAAFGVILRSNNGGTSFQAVLGSFAASTSLSTATGQTEVAISSSGRIMAAINGGHNNTALRGVWTSATGGAGSFSRVAGGQTIGVDSIPGWRANAPTGTGKRILITFAPSNANVGYVFYENGQSSEPPDLKPEADLFRFDISGSSITWSNRSANMPDFPGGNASGSDPLAVQGGYDMMVKVKPDNPNTVFIGGTNLYRSTDGFSTSTNTAWINGYNTNFTYQVYPNGHPDIHELVFNPTNSNEGICGNDGGIQISSNLTAAAPSWRMVSNYQTIQYYYVAMDPDAGRNNFVGGAQDNGVLFRDKMRVLGIPASDSNNHVQMISADGSAVGVSRVSPSNPVQFVYGGYQYGKILRFRLPNVFNPDDIRPGNLTTAYEGADDDYGEFVTNFHLDPDNTEDLYYINFNRLFRTTAASSVTAGGWTELTGVSATVNPSNGRGVSIRAVAFTRGPYNTAHSLFLGTTNGRVFRLDDPRNAAPGKVPVDITPTGLNGNVQDIAVNPNNDNEVLVTVSNYNTVSIWWTNNAKSSFPSWKNAEGNLTLPSIRSCRIAVKKDAANNPVTEYYVGTSVGLYSTENLESILTLNGSPLWRREGDAVLNLAVVQSLAYRPADNVMVIGTHGNGMYYTFLGTANFNPVQTAVEPVTNDKNFIRNVYPTVSPNTVSFETGNMVGIRKIVVQLYDASGRLIYSETKGYTNGSVTLAPFARGTYFLSIYSDGKKYRHLQKLVKQ